MSKEFGWTPRQIAQLEPEDRADYVGYLKLQGQIESEKLEKETKKTKRGRAKKSKLANLEQAIANDAKQREDAES